MNNILKIKVDNLSRLIKDEKKSTTTILEEIAGIVEMIKVEKNDEIKNYAINSLIDIILIINLVLNADDKTKEILKELQQLESLQETTSVSLIQYSNCTKIIFENELPRELVEDTIKNKYDADFKKNIEIVKTKQDGIFISYDNQKKPLLLEFANIENVNYIECLVSKLGI